MKAMGWAVACLAVLGPPTLMYSAFSQDTSSLPAMSAPDQVETRTAVTNLPYTITTAGSYYLTTNLTSAPGQAGVIIHADNVILDLDGFSLIGGGGSNGVFVAPANMKNIAIQNGTIRDWIVDGVNTTNASDCVLERLRASNNGNCGLNVGSRTSVKFCIAEGNKHGIMAGAECILTDCIAQNNSPGDGINLGTGGVISRCVSTSNSSAGIRVSTACMVSSCIAVSNGGGGIIAGPANRIQDCTAAFNGVTDISTGSDNEVTGYTSSTNASAGYFTSSGSAITNRNTVPDPIRTSSSVETNRIEGTPTPFDITNGLDANAASNTAILNIDPANSTNHVSVTENPQGRTRIRNQNPQGNASF
jgi:hypothetical protein